MLYSFFVDQTWMMSIAHACYSTIYKSFVWIGTV